MGDKAQYAHQNVREFPDWYKPYSLNYLGEGWLCLFLSGFALFGWSYMNDIKECKGRKKRKIYPLMRDDTKPFSENDTRKYALERIAAEDPNWTKFLVKKERAAVHH